MIPRLGDGNLHPPDDDRIYHHRLENDSPSRGRKPWKHKVGKDGLLSLENDSPSRGRKQ